MDLPPLNDIPPLSPQYAEALFSQLSTGGEIPPTQQDRDLEPDEPEDIYRGEPPSPPRSPPPRPLSSLSSSSSSSGWSGLGLRRGALGAVLELAINRWARSSSGSSTSSSSSTSVHTRVPRRRPRRSSNATTHNALSENLIRAKRKAREEFRALPREFVLFLPDALVPQATHIRPLREGDALLSQNQERRTLRTASLPLVLAQLDSAIKRSAKMRRPKQLRDHSPGKVLEPWFNDYMQSETSSLTPQGDLSKLGKGKAREGLRRPRNQVPMGAEQPQRQPAWWLDVSSPTWSDMREIGKMLHLHPLTLEDILHQDPREKLELFPRLGYYFIVFRALESERTRSKVHTEVGPNAKDGDGVPYTDKGAIGATNVYIVVFREGICSFHFEDISDHAARVRNRILQLEETVHMSSDWIAHGMLDTIVDDFFPLLNSIEREVNDLDDLVLSIDGQTTNKGVSRGNDVPLELNTNEKKLEQVATEVKEKTQTESSGSDNTPMLGKSLGGSRFLSQLPTSIRRVLATIPVGDMKHWVVFSSRTQQTMSPPSPLRRMASTRKLVTSLTRLLGTKSEVVSQIRKRLAGGAMMGLNAGPSEQALAAEVSIYLGDIQDHILTLQQSLAHYERMLSHSHPAYLSHLRVSLSQAKGGMDKALLMLSVISVTVVAMQLLTGIFSINLGLIPRNRKPPDPLNPPDPPLPPGPFNVFGAIVAGVILVGAGMIYLARYWWLHAKRKYARRSKF